MTEDSIKGFIRGDDKEGIKSAIAEAREYRETHKFWESTASTIIEDSTSPNESSHDADSASDLAPCKESLQGSTAGTPNLDESDGPLSEQEKVLAYIKSQSYHVSCKNIIKATGIKANTIYGEVRRLCDRHELYRDDDHRYYIVRVDAGHGGVSVPDTARLDGIYTGLDFSKIQHFDSLGPRLQNLRVVSGEMKLGYSVPPLSLDVSYGYDKIHLDVSYGVRESRFNWIASIDSGIHVDDLVSLGDYISSVLSYSILYIPREIFYEDLIKAKWYVRQVEVFADDFEKHMSGYYDINTLRGIVCKEYGKADCTRRENQVKRVADDTTLADLSVAVRGSASEIDSNVRIKQLEKQNKSLLDSQSWLIQQVNDMRRDMDAVIRANEAVLEALKHG
jgi:hypothetical protein